MAVQRQAVSRAHPSQVLQKLHTLTNVHCDTSNESATRGRPKKETMTRHVRSVRGLLSGGKLRVWPFLLLSAKRLAFEPIHCIVFFTGTRVLEMATSAASS